MAPSDKRRPGHRHGTAAASNRSIAGRRTYTATQTEPPRNNGGGGDDARAMRTGHSRTPPLRSCRRAWHCSIGACFPRTRHWSLASQGCAHCSHGSSVHALWSFLLTLRVRSAHRTSVLGSDGTDGSGTTETDDALVRSRALPLSATIME